MPVDLIATTAADELLLCSRCVYDTQRRQERDNDTLRNLRRRMKSQKQHINELLLTMGVMNKCWNVNSMRCRRCNDVINTTSNEDTMDQTMNLFMLDIESKSSMPIVHIDADIIDM
jgi:hypothetical protein